MAGAPGVVSISDAVALAKDATPPGMTKERYIEMRVQESIVERDDCDLIVMGCPEGPGCYCYVNTLLRSIIAKAVSGYDFVVIDNGAGMEHISRRTTRECGRLVLVSDYSAAGIRAARRILDLARNLGVTCHGEFLVVNKAPGLPGRLAEEIERSAIPLAGVIPYSESIADSSIAGGVAADRSALDTIRRCLDAILNGVQPTQNEHAGSHTICR